jgi:hypothetical protein
MRHNLNKDGNVYTITGAMRVGGRRKPRTSTVALTDCICYDGDGNVTKVIARNTRSRTTVKRTPRVQEVTRAHYNDHALMSAMGSIHEGDV